MSDDFLFDPWGADEGLEGASVQPEPQGRERAAEEMKGLEPSAVETGAEAAPEADEGQASSPVEPAPEATDRGVRPERRGGLPKATPPPPAAGSRWRARTVLGPLPAERPAPRRRMDGESLANLAEGGHAGREVSAPRETSRAVHNAPSVGQARPRPADSTADRLRAIALPHLEAVAFRLHIARHHTLLDDRLDKQPATLRFRLVPRQAPFDDPVAVPGAVLELMASGSSIGARLWLDPVAEEPAEELEVPVAQFTDGWLESVVVDFVAQTLRQG